MIYFCIFLLNLPSTLLPLVYLALLCYNKIKIVIIKLFKKEDKGEK